MWSVLKHIEDLEGRMADLYELFSTKFSGDREAAVFFIGMSAEENAHRDLVRYQHKLVRRNPEEFKGVNVDISGIKKVAEKVEAVMKLAGDRSLKEAVMTAIDFEKDAAENHYRSAMAQSNAEVSRLLDSLCSADRTHFARLTAFAKDRGFLE